MSHLLITSDEFPAYLSDPNVISSSFLPTWLQVILDVVFNHTAEGNDKGPTLSFRGLDNRVYYMLAPLGEYYNYRCVLCVRGCIRP